MNLSYKEGIPDKGQLFELYEALGWNDFLKLEEDQLFKAMQHSWHIVAVYDNNQLIATGRVISDGVTNAYLCGLGVRPEYRNRGIGTEISRRLVDRCKQSNLHIQLLCEENLVPYYEKLGFAKFAIGMR